MSVHSRKNGTHYCSYRDEFGKQHTKTFGKGTLGKSQAQAFDHEMKMLRKRKQPITKKISNLYFDDLAQKWFRAKKAEGKDKPWLKDWASILNNHILEELCKVPIADLTYEMIVGFITERYKENAFTTRNRYLSYLKVMFNWGIKHGHIKHNPLENWVKSKEVPKELLLTKEDLQKIYDHAAPHTKWAIEVAMNIGVRTGSELLKLKWRHISWENSCVHVFADKTTIWRNIPVRPRFLEKLKEKKSKARTENVIEYNGRTIKSWRKGFRNACRRAGISDNVVSYDVRHLFCVSMLAKKGAPNAVSRLMGHASTKMTLDRYGHVMPGDEIRAVELLPELE